VIEMTPDLTGNNKNTERKKSVITRREGREDAIQAVKNVTGARVWVIYHTTVRVEENAKTEDLTLTESGTRTEGRIEEIMRKKIDTDEITKKKIDKEEIMKKKIDTK